MRFEDESVESYIGSQARSGGQMMETDYEFTIYADGACSNEVGGYAAVIVHPNGERNINISDGPFKDTTNNQMEMMGVIAGMRFVHKRMGPRRLLIISDSKYVVNGITGWIHNWKKYNWITAGGKLVKNVPLWKQMDEACDLHKLTHFQWVKGHAGNRFNEQADKLAVNERERSDRLKSLGVTA